jgi:hypothetical protein
MNINAYFHFVHTSIRIAMNINAYFHLVHTSISIHMNINPYFHLVHTSISIDMNINAYFYMTSEIFIRSIIRNRNSILCINLYINAYHKIIVKQKLIFI